jgi:hypothetical protein
VRMLELEREARKRILSSLHSAGATFVLGKI